MIPLLALALTVGCSRDPIAPNDDAVVMTVPGLGGVQGHAVSVGDSRVLVAGYGGSELQGRMLWANRDGEVLVERVLSSVREPSDIATCVEGAPGAAIFVTESEGEAGTIRRVYRVGIDDQGLSETGAPMWEGPESVRLRDVTGPASTCVLCMQRPEAGELSCQIGIDGEPATWRAEGLGDWSLFEAGGRAMLFDWGLVGERVVVRYAHLDPAVAELTWLGGYDVAHYPQTGLAEGAGAPAIAVVAGDLAVAFLDGTSLENRVFLERLPLGEGEPPEPVLVDSCQSGCGVSWVGVEGGDLWVWYQRSGLSHVARVQGDDVSIRQLPVSPSTHAVGGGYFRLGLSDELGNWRAVFPE